ncbi:MAG: head GIN domain-containing protein [Candidatus Aegiribacteria sp.]
MVLAGIALVVLIPILAGVLTGVLLILAVVFVLLLFIVPLALLFRGVFHRTVKGSGVKETESRRPEPFSSLSVSGKVRARVLCGRPREVSVTTDDNLLQYLDTRVKNGELSVGFNRPVSSGSGVELEVSVQELKGLTISGAAEVFISDVASDELSIGVGGTAEVRASGKADTLRLKISGAGKIYASELAADKASVRITGAGRVELRAEKELTVRISGAGSVSCAGQPEKVTKHITGAGRVTLV